MPLQYKDLPLANLMMFSSIIFIVKEVSHFSDNIYANIYQAGIVKTAQTIHLCTLNKEDYLIMKENITSMACGLIGCASFKQCTACNVYLLFPLILRLM